MSDEIHLQERDPIADDAFRVLLDWFMATGDCPDILRPFNLRRYENHRLMGETAALVSYTPDN